jgi:hypothetical protein
MTQPKDKPVDAELGNGSHVCVCEGSEGTRGKSEGNQGELGVCQQEVPACKFSSVRT